MVISLHETHDIMSLSQGGDDLTRLFSLCVYVWVSNDDLVSPHSVINELMVIKLSQRWDLWDDGADVYSLVVSLVPDEMEDFNVVVKASGETVRAGQPFNITCVAPPGPGLQQQWLHPKKQARCKHFSFLFNFSLVFLYGFIHNEAWLLSLRAPFLSTPCHISMSFPTQQHRALN